MTNSARSCLACRGSREQRLRPEFVDQARNKMLEHDGMAGDVPARIETHAAFGIGKNLDAFGIERIEAGIGQHFPSSAVSCWPSPSAMSPTGWNCRSVGYISRRCPSGVRQFVADQHLAPELSEIGVMLLMFGVGLHFSLGDLLSVNRIAIPGAIVQMLLATLLGMLATHLWGWLGQRAGDSACHYRVRVRWCC